MLTAKLEKTENQFTKTRYSLDFYGNNQLVEMLQYWSALTSLNGYNVIVEVNNFYDKKIEQLIEKSNNIRAEIGNIKQQHNLPVVFYRENYKKVKALEKQFDALLDACAVLSYKKENPNDSKLQGKVLLNVFENFLAKNNFNLTNTESNAFRVNDVYEFNGNEQELLNTVTNIVNELVSNEKSIIKYELKNAKIFVKENGIDKLLENTKQQETEIER